MSNRLYIYNKKRAEPTELTDKTTHILNDDELKNM